MLSAIARNNTWVRSACCLLLTTACWAHADASEPPGEVVRPLAVIHTVAALDRSLAFYRDVIGLPLAAAPAFPSGGGSALQRLTHATGSSARSATLSIPGSELQLVLVRYTGLPQHRVQQRLQDPGVVKLVLRVRDIVQVGASRP